MEMYFEVTHSTTVGNIILRENTMMQKTITFHVEKEDIIEGQPGKFNLCPIALALKRKLRYPPYSYAISVGLDTLYINGILYTLSKKARKFIDDFDNGLPVHCSTFRIHLYERPA